MFSKETIQVVLNGLIRYELESDNRGYMSQDEIKENCFGQYVRIEDVAKLFGLKVDFFNKVEGA